MVACVMLAVQAVDQYDLDFLIIYLIHQRFKLHKQNLSWCKYSFKMIIQYTLKNESNTHTFSVIAAYHH